MGEGWFKQLVAKICRGFGARFAGQPCEYYSSPVRDCSLLREGKMEEIATKGRCTFAMLNVAQERLARSFDSLDEREDIDVGVVIERLKNTVANGGYGIQRWFNRTSKAFRNATLDLLRARRVIPRQDNCGFCRSLTTTRPYLCTMTGEERGRTDEVCEDYSRISFVFESMENVERTEAVGGLDERYQGIERRTLERRFLGTARRLLKERVMRAQQGAHEQVIRIRQYNLFVNLWRLLGVLDSRREALQVISQETGIPMATLSNDLIQIREYLKSTRRI